MDFGESLAPFLFLAALLVLSALPLFAAYLYLLKKRPTFVPKRFFFCALLGVIAVIPAMSLQVFFPEPSSTWFSLFLHAFVTIALSEEAAKYLCLRLGRRFSPITITEGPAAGLAASLALALFETAAYSTSDPSIALLRAVTAAPLHAACGIRVGLSALSPLYKSPRSLLSLLFAVLVHGTYDLTLSLPGFPRLVPILIALFALSLSLPLVGRENTPSPRSGKKIGDF